MQAIKPDEQARVSTALADPQAAAALRYNRVRRNVWKDRLGLLTFAAAASLVAVQASGPTTSETHTHGVTEVVIDAALSQNATDTTDHMSRLQDSINGAAMSDHDESIPYSFVIDNPVFPASVKIPETNKSTSYVEKSLNSAVDHLQSRNGEDIDNAAQEGISQAVSNSGGNVILITSAFIGNGNTDTSQEEQQNLQNEVNTLPKSVKVEAVVVGSDQQQTLIGGSNGIDIATPVDPTGFEAVLGKSKVHTADSATQIENTIDKIVETLQIDVKDKPTDLPIVIGGALVLISGLISVSRRANGIYRGRQFRRVLTNRKKESSNER